MATKIFVNLPVKDLNRSVEFFTKLGFSFDAKFTDTNATCMIVSEAIFVMLLTEKFFKNFTKKEIADTSKTIEAMVTLSADNREAVDAFLEKAVAAGATTPNEPYGEQDFMYGRSFDDLDGHHWDIMYMDSSAVNQE